MTNEFSPGMLVVWSGSLQPFLSLSLVLEVSRGGIKVFKFYTYSDDPEFLYDAAYFSKEYVPF